MVAAIPLGLSALSAFGSIQQGEMTSDSLNAQAKINQSNAIEAQAKGSFDAMKQQIMANKVIGSSIAGYGAAGVTANSGSVLDTVHTSTMNSEFDRLNILHGADVRAINFSNQAALDKYGAQSAIKGSYFKALGSLTQGAFTAASMGAGAKPGGVMGDGGGEVASTGESIYTGTTDYENQV